MSGSFLPQTRSYRLQTLSMSNASATTAAAIPVRRIRVMQPLNWLERAWHDIRRTPIASFSHGAALALFGWILLLLAHQHFWVLAGSLSGFLLVAPVLATGLYGISRALERGEPADLNTALAIWSSFDRRLVKFGLLLAAAGTGWVITSAALITLYAPGLIQTPIDFLHHVVTNRESWLFEIWIGLGGLLAAPVFASSVVAIPLMLDRRIGVLAAVLTSWRVVMENPEGMAVWAAIIMGLTLLGMGSLLIGLVVVIPMLGHASWYAYRDLIDVSALPAIES